MARPKYISVFIPTYNGNKYIAESIEAILDQEIPNGYSLELIVIDSGSKDNTVSIIKEKYLELIIEHEKTGLALVKANKSKYTLNNEKELVRNLSYYGKGDQI